MVVSVLLLCLPSVCSVASYIQYLIHLDALVFVPNTFYTHNLSKYGLFQSLSQYGLPKPWFTHMLWFKLKLCFEQNQCFCVQTIFYTKSCFTQTLCYPQTPCFTQKPYSCWACARAVCILQDSSCHGGRRNTPKAVKYFVNSVMQGVVYPCGMGGVF